MKKTRLLVLVVFYLFSGCGYSTENQHRTTPIVVNVKDYGATGNDNTDDTAAIQKAVDDVSAAKRGNIVIPEGTYIIDAVKSIRLSGNMQLWLSPDTTLKAAPNGSPNYAIVKIVDADNVEVSGGLITGERDNHFNDIGEWGHAIQILGSSHVKIADVTISDCWGDGIYIGSSKEQNYCGDVIIENFAITNCRRNGITVISGKSVTIRQGVISDTNGTDPQSAICMEPNSVEEYLEDILIEDVQANNSAKYGLLFGLARYVDTPHDVRITLKNFTSFNHGIAIFNNYRSYPLSKSTISINIP